jgi:polysaccharide biosynthesis protein PslF
MKSENHASLWRSPALAVVSTYPPTACGLATFAAALTNGLSEIGIRDVGVVRVCVDESATDDMRVIGHLRPSSLASRQAIIRRLDDYDCVLLQHEYGIYGGNDGREILDLIDGLGTPVVTTLHTVPLVPSAGQRSVLESVVDVSARVVTMSEAASRRLWMHYDVDPSKVVNIAHGATVPRVLNPPVLDERTTFLTWGLLGPGKGVEWVVDALGHLAAKGLDARYVIAGRTHPKVLENEGEAYRDMLMARAERLGVADMVEFDSSYRPLPSLIDLIARATCVVLPYDSDDQITSGVLVDAIAAGRPVIATRFPHAAEVLESGAGLVVEHADSRALAAAMERVVTDRSLVANMAMVAAAMAPNYRWSVIAAEYADLAAQVANLSRLASDSLTVAGGGE